MQFDDEVKHIAGIKNVVADLFSRLLKNHMETQIVEDHQRTRRWTSQKVQKAVDEVVLTLLFHHELLFDTSM